MSRVLEKRSNNKVDKIERGWKADSESSESQWRTIRSAVEKFKKGLTEMWPFDAYCGCLLRPQVGDRNTVNTKLSNYATEADKRLETWKSPRSSKMPQIKTTIICLETTNGGMRRQRNFNLQLEGSLMYEMKECALVRSGSEHVWNLWTPPPARRGRYEFNQQQWLLCYVRTD